jgi:hypothetical protein
VAELTDAADAFPLLVGEREPPPGFEQRVLTELRAGRRGPRRRLLTAIAVAAAAAAILSITVVRVVDAGSEAAAPGPPRAATFTQARLVTTGNGDPAGWAYVSGKRSVALAVDYGVSAGSYDIRVHPARGEPVKIGDMTVAENRGSWTGTSTVNIGSGSEISLVDPRGAQVCHGTVEANR